MIEARVLGKDRQWMKKRVFGRKQFFKLREDPTNYEIHPDSIYWRRFLGMKIIRCIDYVQNVKTPLRYDDLGNAGFTNSEFGLDEASYIISKAMKSVFIVLACALSGISCVIGVMCLLKLFGMLEGAA